MRPIAYGLIVFFGGGIMWVLFSVLAGTETAFQGTSQFMPLVYVFGMLFFFSLPVAVGAEVIRWARRRRQDA